MGLIGKIIAGKVVAKAMQKMKARARAAEAALPAQPGQYIPAGALEPAAARHGVAYRAADFYQKNPKLVAGAATLIMAALAASLSKGRKLR